MNILKAIGDKKIKMIRERERSPLARFITIILVLGLGLFLTFKGLGSKSLWEDEGQTALIARNILHYGYPTPYDGNFFLTGTGGVNEVTIIGQHYLWTYHPWLQFYVTALSLSLLGESNLSARLPFALAGLVTIFIVYLLAREVFTSKKIGALAVFLTLTSPYTLFHFRQARYYSLTMLFVVLSSYAYLRFLKSKDFKITLFLALSLLFLAVSQDFIFLLTAFAMLIHYLSFGRWTHSRKIDLKDVIPFLFLLLVILPWFILRNKVGIGSIEQISLHIGPYLSVINRYLLPFSLLLIAIVINLLFKKRVALNLKQHSYLIFLIMLISVGLLGTSWAKMPFYIHYISPFAPLLLMLAAYLLWNIFKVNRTIGVVCILLVSFTNLLTLPGDWLVKPLLGKLFRKTPQEYISITGPATVVFHNTPFLPFKNYIQEISHSEPDITKTFSDYLKENAKPTEKIYASAQNVVLYFYTNLGLNTDTIQHPALKKFDTNTPKPDIILKYGSPEIPYEWAKENYKRITIGKAECFEDFNNSLEFSLLDKDFSQCKLPLELPTRYIWKKVD